MAAVVEAVEVVAEVSRLGAGAARATPATRPAARAGAAVRTAAAVAVAVVVATAVGRGASVGARQSGAAVEEVDAAVGGGRDRGTWQTVTSGAFRRITCGGRKEGSTNIMGKRK